MTKSCKHLNASFTEVYRVSNVIEIEDGFPELSGTDIDHPMLLYIEFNCNDCILTTKYYVPNIPKWLRQYQKKIGM